MKTVVSSKGQVVIPKQIREKLGLVPGTVLRVWVEGKNIVLEPIREPPKQIFVKAGPKVTERILKEAKTRAIKHGNFLKI